MIEWHLRTGWPAGAGPLPELQTAEQLHKLTAGLIACHDSQTIVDVTLDGAIDLHGSNFGSLQFLQPDTGVLELVGQRGFTPEFVETFRTVLADDPCACGRALRQKCAIVVEDVDQDAEYEPYREIARRAGYGAVQSTPIMTSNGSLLGVLSTHFPEPHSPSEFQMRVIDLFARQAGEILHRLRAEEAMQQDAKRKDLVVKELSHRIMNVLTMVQAISRESMKGSDGLGQYAEVFGGRMKALAHAHESLAKSQWQGTTIDQLLHEQLADFSDGRFSWSGPIIKLSPNSAYVLAMVVHELGVNARKHGALRSNSGRITIQWSEDAANDSLLIRWTESGGPEIEEPTQVGFGGALLRSLERTGFVKVVPTYDPSGLVCELTLPGGST